VKRQMANGKRQTVSRRGAVLAPYVYFP